MKATRAERFWGNVTPSDGCWLWQGRRIPTGYGYMYDPETGTTMGAHRISYELHRGPIAAGLCVCHTCDTPACVNPDHLWLGTRRQNSQDMCKKGRCRSGGTNGSRHGRSKLTEESARQIVQLANSGAKHRDLAERFGVTKSTVTSVVAGETWGHATGVGVCP